MEFLTIITVNVFYPSHILQEEHRWLLDCLANQLHIFLLPELLELEIKYLFKIELSGCIDNVSKYYSDIYKLSSLVYLKYFPLYHLSN